MPRYALVVLLTCAVLLTACVVARTVEHFLPQDDCSPPTCIDL